MRRFNIGMILRWLVGTVKLDLNFVNEGQDLSFRQLGRRSRRNRRSSP